MIRVSRCRILRCSAGEVGVRQDEGTQVSLDLRAFVHELVAFFNSARRWTECDIARALQERPVLVSLEDGIQQAPAASSYLRDARPNADLAIVPFDPARLPQSRDVSTSITALSRLHRDISEVGGGSIDRSRIADSSQAYVETAIATGVLRLVGDDSERIALNMSAVDWTTVLRLRKLVPLHLSACALDKPLQLTKGELLMALRLAGWQHHSEVPLCWSPGDPKTLTFSWRRPLSYFAALLQHQVILDKGVGTIKHNGLNHYYQCLLGMPSERLLPLLQDAAENAPDDWYRAKFVDAVGDLPEDGEYDLVAAAVHDEDLLPCVRRVGPIIPLAYRPVLWVRCRAKRVGPYEGFKIWFDAATGGLGRQRGWSFCHAHACRPYRFCDSFESRRHMAAWMILWHEAATLEECKSRPLHLAFQPPSTVVDVLAASVELEDF